MSDKQSEENVMKNWAQEQQKLLTDWLETLRKYGGTPTLELWRKTVDTWQSSVKETLDAQMEWTNQWTETMAKAKGTPEELRELAREGREQLQRWTEAERDLWRSWFDTIREINFRPESGAGTQTGGDLIQFWQDTANKMINTQADLVRRWTEGFTGTKKQEKTSDQ
jgi:small-conductance mechanosensitive channel